MLTFKKDYELGPKTQSCFKKKMISQPTPKRGHQLTSQQSLWCLDMKGEFLLLLLLLSQTGVRSKEHWVPISMTGRPRTQPTLEEGATKRQGCSRVCSEHRGQNKWAQARETRIK